MIDQRLNCIISIDLHIHSAMSGYKENIPEIKQCNIENLNTLFSKLQSNGINMFSITDHNRFDSELYLAINEKINAREFQGIYSVLPGIEFDVRLEEDKEKCHIIVIFNDSKPETQYKKIASVIEKHLLVDPNLAYSKTDFVTILTEIGLDTILIAHQRNALNIPGHHDSLGDATDEPLSYLGFIDALEFNKSRVEGILIDNLLNAEKKLALLKGSDCHDWANYPNHDKKTRTEEYFTKIKALPTFKGLLMALTSPDTRFNRSDEQADIRQIDSISIDGVTIEFSSGINAIIGENGAGKSTILSLLNNDESKRHLKDIKKINNVVIPKHFNQERTIFIKQAELINASNENGLFSGAEYYKAISYDDFCSEISEYRDKLFAYVEANIKTAMQKESLNKTKITLQGILSEFYYVNVLCEANFANIENEYKERLKRLNATKKQLSTELSYKNIYSKSNISILEHLIEALQPLIEFLQTKDSEIEYDRKVRNIIQGCIGTYKETYSHLQSQAAQETQRYKEKINKIVGDVVQVISEECKQKCIPIFPSPCKLCNENRARGFVFRNASVFSDIELKEKYLEYMFNCTHRDEGKIMNIKSTEEFADAIPSARVDNYKIKWENCHNKFIEEAKKESHTIIDENNNMNQIEGRTLGELSLIYYKYLSYNSSEFDLLVIDQPEDNISNNRIGTQLISFMNNMRDKVQIIFVTHNPMLVVNLDVDNVIFLRNKNNKVIATYGCLESGDILDRVSLHMDGGKRMIERRLRVYGKENETSNE